MPSRQALQVGLRGLGIAYHLKLRPSLHHLHGTYHKDLRNAVHVAVVFLTCAASKPTQPESMLGRPGTIFDDEATHKGFSRVMSPRSLAFRSSEDHMLSCLHFVGG